MWNDSLRIGVDKIDEQHKTLFLKVGHLIDDIIDTGEYQKEKIISTILFLKEYAVTHFADEEAYQISINDKNYLKHKKMHENFVATVLRHEKKMVESDFAYKDVSKFAGTLLAWLTYHVSDVDQKIGKATADDIDDSENYADIICDCFCDMISNITNINKDAIVKVDEHDEVFNDSITIKHSFTHIIKGYVVFYYSFSFINKLIYGLIDTPHEENEIGSFEENFLLQISTMAVENVYRRLYVDEYEVDEAEISVIPNDEKAKTIPQKIVAFDTELGIVEVGFSVT
ncbi:MAG: hypothetical protein FWF94_08600 [Oscillospiraceae bacterium]|nr:hypothetical protein [Oscillospiraceae bacterium]